ncbi:MAG: hypothetical protein ACYS9C_07200, partial [Planctomycetota bacterium]|jgi:hypothetical protein
LKLSDMAEYCDTLQSKEERNREYEACLSERAILRLLDWFASENWAVFGGICVRLSAVWLAEGIGPENFDRQQSTLSQFVMSIVHAFKK